MRRVQITRRPQPRNPHAPVDPLRTPSGRVLPY